VDTRSVLGLSTLWATLLDHLSATQPRESETGNGARVTIPDCARWPLPSYSLQDEPDYSPDEDDDEDDEDEDDPHDEDEDDEDGDVETWQV
jgi:hypothetical protein